MSRNVYAVFSRRPEGVSAEEYNAWYAHHARENVEVPGLLRAERFAATLTSGAEADKGSEWHLALYEFEGDPDTWRADLRRRRAAGEVDLPVWFDGVEFRSWVCIGVESGIEAPPA
ncbi:MAG TPA: hypothetical protein VNQ73_19925 [Ilumatobacter sp.]|nr:hypothetical protein [Ilumatobacter sp.]